MSMQNELLHEKPRRSNTSPEYQEVRQHFSELASTNVADKEIVSTIERIRGTNLAKPFEQLQLILDGHLVRSGVNEIRLVGDLLFLHLPSVKWPVRSDESTAGYSSFGIIFLDDRVLRQTAKKMGLNLRMFMLHVLLHEIGHAVADFRMEQLGADPVRFKFRMGVGQIITSHRGTKTTRSADGLAQESEAIYSVHLLEFLDELINDDFTETVSREFASASGFATRAEVDTFYKQWRSFRQKNPLYAHTGRLKSILVTRIAKHAGIDDPKRVQNALWRAALEGFDAFHVVETGDGTKKRLLDEVTGSGFVERLSQLNSLESLDQLLRDYHLESFFQRTAVWLKRKGWLA